MRFLRLFYMIAKQYSKRPESILLLISLPLLTFLLSRTSQTEEQRIRAVCYIPCATSQDEYHDSYDSFASLSQRLSQYDGLYDFSLCSTPQEVYDAVAGNHAECGYIFSEDLFEKLLDGDLEKLVTTVSSPSTTMLPIINETVYSLIFEELAADRLELYLSESSAVSDGYGSLYDHETIRELYDKYLLGDSAFHFEYNETPFDYHLVTASVLLSPIRGLLAVLMLISAMAGAIAYYRLAANPIFDTWKVRICSISTPVLFSYPVTLLCLYFAGLKGSFMQEAFCLLLYAASCILTTFCITLCIKKRVIFTSLLPLYTLACLVFTPVFIDITLFLPMLKPLSYLFPPYYYLTWQL